VSPVRYELGVYIPEDGILHSHRHENLKTYTLYLLIYISQRIPLYCNMRVHSIS
jgi:hypothetical protein